MCKEALYYKDKTDGKGLGVYYQHLDLFKNVWQKPWVVIDDHLKKLKEMQTRTVELLQRCPLPLRISYKFSVPREIIPSLPLPEGVEHLTLAATKESMFTMYVFGDKTNGAEHVAVIKDIGNGENIPIRVHSSCLTAETFHASNCDCHEQLEMTLKIAEEKGLGGVIWLYQEGRGNGLTAKAKQLKIMIEEKLDTVDAFEKAGYSKDRRTYEQAADILKLLGIKSVELITNNPSKVDQIKKSGITVVGIIPCKTEPVNDIVRKDLKAKKEKLGHIL